ncbi:isochorismatase family protein [Rhizomonospora bruguierae]|uniref:isochorismatase family protein n=1 Tax=Rhizomonospora bruguierae TaxID=1581705 RepID=UPI001BD03086|nr:isochorismatase family protein [Micromonospora sp. NBRC 107566]
MPTDAPSPQAPGPGVGRPLQLRTIDDVAPGWRSLLAPGEEHVVARYGKPRGPGSRPALLVIDFQHSYLGRDAPVEEQLDEFPAGAGAAAWRALERAVPIVAAARAARVPVISTVVAHDPSQGGTQFDDKRHAATVLMQGAIGASMPAILAPQEDELFIVKGSASVFHGTILDAHLAEIGADTVVVTGLSTSGCIRASVVDAAARGLRPIVVADAVGDRVGISHRVALLDMWMKYADLCLADDAIAWLRSLSDEAIPTSRRPRP